MAGLLPSLLSWNLRSRDKGWFIETRSQEALGLRARYQPGPGVNRTCTPIPRTTPPPSALLQAHHSPDHSLGDTGVLHSGKKGGGWEGWGAPPLAILQRLPYLSPANRHYAPCAQTSPIGQQSLRMEDEPIRTADSSPGSVRSACAQSQPVFCEAAYIECTAPELLRAQVLRVTCVPIPSWAKPAPTKQAST